MNHFNSNIAIELKNISKQFGNVRANTNINLRIKKGSIHGIIGENGAGKSTLVKIIYGLYQPDRGEIYINDTATKILSPVDAVNHKIGMVHQHFMLADPFSALDNIILTQKTENKSPWLPLFLQPLSRNKQKAKLQKLIEKNNFQINLEQNVEEIPVGQQQQLEITKLLANDSDILILDEPTAVLTPQETLDLFKNLKSLKASGKTIIIITHKLKEILSLTDEITIIRKGEVVGNKITSETNLEELAELMVGRKVHINKTHHLVPSLPQDTLKISNLSFKEHGVEKLKNINLRVSKSEILGIAGVEGNGQQELIKCILQGNRNLKSGTILLNQIEIDHLNPSSIREFKIGYLPEDRIHQGLLSDLPLYENFILGKTEDKEIFPSGLLAFKALKNKLSQLIQKFDIRPTDIFLKSGSLSGGNQQKLVVARELCSDPEFILAAQPTRGVDIGAIEFIHDQIIQHRNRGAAVLLISSELEELMSLSDRILVLYKGQINAEFSKETFDELKIGAAMGGKIT